MALSDIAAKELAKRLYIDGTSHEEIAKAVERSTRTIGRWVKDSNWDKQKKYLMTTRDEQLRFLYDQLEKIKIMIDKRTETSEGNGVLSSKETDQVSKLTASINRLEKETGVGETLNVFKNLCTYTAKNDPEHLPIIRELCNSYVKTILV